MQLSYLVLALAGTAAAQPDCTRADYHRPGSTAIYMPFRGSSIECELGIDNNSNGVKALQEQINLCYGRYLDAKLVVDGDFGSKTREGVREVQRRSGARVDGRYGPETRGKMNWGVYFNGNPNDVVCRTLERWKSS
ncbi:hypothetical protein QBC34DRAFT_416238 [Podospora aff. communis PSN243]|uniref:Peptidoglycan binding-like domain-containing protein n=1 Tax=Podospora aff. communis PSN243 TaxID=3040156 RepID=A0AAV9G6U9_9PEZI|nr:hypothetical protein QBC34DRAFT_416238 [Podospora aff. communis PSN243]